MRQLIVILMLAIFPHVYAAQGHGDGDAHPGSASAPSAGDNAEPAQPFDEQAALKYSQAAIGRTLDGLALRNHKGEAVTLADYRGKPLVISMVYTSCFHICPTTTQHLARAVKQARSAVGDNTFTIATIGFDVHNDTPERMRAWARQQGVHGDDDWIFLSVDHTEVERLAATLGFLYTRSSKGFDHLIQATVADKDGKIFRQIYGMEFNPGYLVGAMQELVLSRAAEVLSLSALINKVRLYCTRYDPLSDAYRFDYSMIFASGIGVVIFIFLGIYVVRTWRRTFSPNAP